VHTRAIRPETLAADAARPDRIQVTEAVHERLKTEFVSERRGFIEVKDKGSTLTYLLVGRVEEDVDGDSVKPSAAAQAT